MCELADSTRDSLTTEASGRQEPGLCPRLFYDPGGDACASILFTTSEISSTRGPRVGGVLTTYQKSVKQNCELPRCTAQRTTQRRARRCARRRRLGGSVSRVSRSASSSAVRRNSRRRRGVDLVRALERAASRRGRGVAAASTRPTSKLWPPAAASTRPTSSFGGRRPRRRRGVDATNVKAWRPQVLGVVGTLVCVSVLGPHNDARDIMSMVDLDFKQNNPNCGHFEVVCLKLKDAEVCTNKMPRGCENDPACDDNREYERACCKGLYEPSHHIRNCFF